MADILHLVNIAASPDKVFAALTEQRGLAGWWTEDVKAEPRVGSVAQFRFGDNGGSDMAIVALEPHHLVRWRCVGHLSGEEWIGTELFFELVPGKNAPCFASATGAGSRPRTSCASAACGGRSISSP